eukprot:gnl/TRDRNA2_/TRDRNA2_168758_c0_seq1.p1 gnl/TRDRNA2_/TRDRNA2_168758_c0~~gnl/TRDRNA2_/TRDRNA2_168758_c0_seq1.p1  ORF type:complete len:630 (-),score=104.00 gnl/TRDRNA2_/TRDRNA2_168758_c0_seq1:82-1839(-)
MAVVAPPTAAPATAAASAHAAAVPEAVSMQDAASDVVVLAPDGDGGDGEKAVPPAEPRDIFSSQQPASAAALARCLTAVRASVRLRLASGAMERLRWRCHAAKRARLVTTEQCTELENRLQPTAGGDGPDDVRDVLDGLGVPCALDDIIDETNGSQWECAICCNQQRMRGWRCPFQHRFCRLCMVRWSNEKALPACPHSGCGYQLGEHDLEDLRVPTSQLEAFRAARLEQGLADLQANPNTQAVTVFRCSGVGCGAAVVLGTAEERRCYKCACGAPPVCTACGASPHHYHAACSDMQALRARWLAWIQGGREAYQGLQRRVAREANAQQKALREAMDRHTELEQDEQWKAENCRLCPKCQRPVEKVDGCNTMVCGQNTHGGNRQQGCGNRFNWKDARPYRPRVGPARLPAAPAVSRAGALSGRGVRHLFVRCSLCGSGSKCILGPRFRCVHCPSFDVCLKCEPKLAEVHQEDHVFEILFEVEFDFSQTGVVLPRGTKARVRSRAPGPVAAADSCPAGAAGAARRKRGYSGLEGVVRGYKRGRYTLELAGGEGTKQVMAKDLMPLITQQQAERLLATAPGSERAAA